MSRKKKNWADETCHCPKDLRNGVNGFYHLVPIECVATKREIKQMRKFIKDSLEVNAKEGQINAS